MTPTYQTESVLMTPISFKQILKYLLPLVLFVVNCVDAVHANNDRALELARSGNFAQASEILTPKAQKGDQISQLYLGHLFKEGGNGFPRNEDRAFHWFMLSAEQGNADAQYEIGEMYEDGEGVTQDYNKAYKWNYSAAQKGHLEAIRNVAFSNYFGQGVSKNIKVALDWYETAASLGDTFSQSRLGTHFYYVDKDYDTAFKWLKQASEGGDEHAQKTLGYMYRDGKGVIQDYVYAHMWLNIARSNSFGRRAEDTNILVSILSSKMTPDDISYAHKLARECVAKDYKGC